ncbi:MAG: right-handed parallel beta-helix repeat-containing protein, partial [Candidatus Lokiarchaeota archaeon]|nr:right-handed parallel beta-helix repeat-containing protein [Candidatus Lokiarchaeota archaeon]
MNNNRKKKILILSFLGISLFIIAAFIETDNSLNNIFNDVKIINRDIIQNDDENNIGHLKVSGYENPIEINGSATGVGAHNWTWAQAQSWCTGSGTESEPYIIEDIIINGVGSNQCIGIYESNEYFIIRNCTFYNSRGTAATDSGIKLLEVTNGKIINSYCLNNTVGIYLFESSYNTIAENSLYNNSYYGIQLYYNSSYNTISDNSMNNNSIYGLDISTSGLFAPRCIYNTIIKNNLSYNENKGIFLYFSDNNIITENLVSFNAVEGMFIKWSNGNDIYKNYFLNNTHHAQDEYDIVFHGINNWNNTVIGNYWDNHSTGDADGDGIDDNGYTYIPGAANPVDYLPIYGDPFHDGGKVHIDGNQASGNNSWKWSSTRAWCSGSGALDDPYIISDLEINAENDGNCILIGNSSVYFKIENSKLLNSGSGSMDGGIKLDSVDNAQLIGNNCSNNQCGISLYLSNNTDIIENMLQENYYGVCLNDSDSNTISENTFVDNTEYALEENSVGNTFENNYCIPPLTITNVTSTNANGTYRFGETIEIIIVFSDVVYVTGTPQLTLETGDNDAVVDYTSGSATNTLSFNYTVALDHNSTDLDYISTGALDLNSGTIKGIVGNNANITLPAPGASGSLSFNRNIIVDAKTPSVNSVSSTKADGFYTTGEEINITITFSEIVYVTGTPQLTLETGGAGATVDYTSGNKTDTLIFTYTVASGHTSSDLDYISTSALDLNSGTIKDSEGYNADLVLPTPGTAGSISHSKDIVIDTTDPTGSIIINSGDTWTNSTSVTLSLTYGDALSGVLEVRYSNDGSTWDPWEAAGTTKAWVLSSGDGTKTVYYEVKDNAQLISQFTDTIILDTTAPTGSISINSGDTWTNSTSVTLSLTYGDALSGVLEVRYSNDGSTWDPWEAPGATKTWDLSSGDGTKTVYYEVKDNAQLISQFTDTIILDTTAPTGS